MTDLEIAVEEKLNVAEFNQSPATERVFAPGETEPALRVKVPPTVVVPPKVVAPLVLVKAPPRVTVSPNETVPSAPATTVRALLLPVSVKTPVTDILSPVSPPVVRVTVPVESRSTAPAKVRAPVDEV